METSENIKEISEILKKYEISTIEQLEHILFKRKSNNESLKMKYQKNEDYRRNKKKMQKSKSIKNIRKMKNLELNRESAV